MPQPRDLHGLVLTGLAFALPMGALVGAVTRRPEVAVAAGVAAGLLFAFAFHLFLSIITCSSLLEPGGRPPRFDPGENVVRMGLANHFRRAEGVGGKLYLTTERLRFRAHRLNFQVHDESFPLDGIAGVETARTLGFLHNGLHVILRDGRREHFVVTGSATWAEAIRTACTHHAAARSCA